MKSIFINPDLQYLRAGWRVGIFILVFATCSLGLGYPIGVALKLLPFIDIQPVRLFFMYVLLTLATWITLRFLDKRSFETIGLTLKASWAKELLTGFVLGSGMISIVFGIEYFSGMVQIEYYGFSLEHSVYVGLYSLFLFIVVGYGEELLFRGYILQISAEGTNRLISALSYSVVFALAHINNPNVSTFGLINVFLAGVWLSIAYFKTNALWFPIGLHISWNFFQGFVFSYPVSGTSSVNEQLGRAIVTGPEWLTGGAFGPEGGALTTAVLIVASIYIYKSRRIASSENVWQYSFWVEQRKQQLESQQSLPIQP